MHRGYLPIWRKFFEEHPFWQEKRKFSKAEAWIDILVNTHFELQPKQRLIRGRMVTIEYGQCLMTTRYCGQRWGWHKTTVQRFLDMLSKMEQISVKCVQQMSIITVLNFEKYDPKRASDVSSGGPVAGQWRASDVSKLNNGKNGNNIYMSDKLSPDALKVYEFYIKHVSLESTAGTKQPALNNLKKWLKEYSADELIESVKNYASTRAGESPRFNKKPANFFGRSQDSKGFFKGFLPGVFQQQPEQKKPRCPEWL